MKITKLYIHDFQQFRDFELDFTDPKTGLPLERVCLIGRNGTGKSTLLSLMSYCLLGFPLRGVGTVPAAFGMKVLVDESPKWVAASVDGNALKETHDNEFEEHIRKGLPTDRFPRWGRAWPAGGARVESLDALTFCPADDPVLVTGLPSTQLNNALPLFKNFPIYHEVGGTASANFWNLLIYLIKKRESDWQEFLKLPDNSSRTAFEAGSGSLTCALRFKPSPMLPRRSNS